MAINSHIQLPNSILKYFRDESDSEKKVWYLDISSGSIMKAASNKIGTSKGYYSDFGENFWNRTVEDSLAKLNHIYSVSLLHVGASFISLAPTFFQKVRAHSFRCSSFSSRKRSAGLRLDEMRLWIGASFSST